MTRVEVIASAIANARRMHRGMAPEGDVLELLAARERQQLMSEAEWVASKLEQYDEDQIQAEFERGSNGA